MTKEQGPQLQDAGRSPEDRSRRREALRWSPRERQAGSGGGDQEAGHEPPGSCRAGEEGTGATMIDGLNPTGRTCAPRRGWSEP